MNPVPPVRNTLIWCADYPLMAPRRRAGSRSPPEVSGAGPRGPQSFAFAIGSSDAGHGARPPTGPTLVSWRTALEFATQGRAERALAIGVTPGANGDGDPLAELKELLRTAGVATAGELVQVRAAPDPDRYLGRGKLSELREQIRRDGANLVACDDELAPRQERNLEAALDVPVIDRTAIILDIFADHAHSAEGKLQVELAQLEYNLARMRGLWTHLERLGAGRIDGGIGTRGPGESQIETDHQACPRPDHHAAAAARARPAKPQGQRAHREASTTPTVALAGYTNAGKSTLLNALTGAGVGVGRAARRSTRRRARTSTTVAGSSSRTLSASSASFPTSWSRRSRRRSRKRGSPT